MTVLLVCIGLVAAIAAVFLFHPRRFVSWVNEQNPDVLFCVDTEEPVVALTIDDGPHSSLTPAILDLLGENNAKCTFFVLGDQIPGNEKILQRIVDEGHELGNHLFSDTPSVFLAADEFERQLLEVDRMIETGPVKWFRPGSGWFTRRMLDTARKHSYRCALGSVYPIDTRVPIPGIVIRNALGGLQAGAILVLHDGTEERRRVLDILEVLLPAIRQRGFRVVSLSQLIAFQRDPVTAPAPATL